MSEEPFILAIGSKSKWGIWAKTVTTKQDRNPNSGIIAYGDEKLTEINEMYLTESNTVAYMTAPEIKITAT